MTLPLTLRSPVWQARLDEPVVAVGSNSAGSTGAALGSEGTAILFDRTTGQIQHRWSAHAGGGFRLAWHPSLNLLVTSGADGKVRWWDPLSAELHRELTGGNSWVELLEWSPNGEFLAFAAGRILTLARADGTVLHTWKNHPSTLAALTWRNDNLELAGACYGGIHIYDPASLQLRQTLPWKSSLLSVAWSPNHRWIVAGTQELSIQIWPLPFSAGEELAMSGYAGKVRELAWHHGSRYLATGGSEQITVWDCNGNGPSGTTPRILDGHTERITALAYQTRGHLLASGGHDGRVCFWNARQPVALQAVPLSAPVTTLAWTRDEQSVLAGTHDGAVALLKAPAA